MTGAYPSLLYWGFGLAGLAAEVTDLQTDSEFFWFPLKRVAVLLNVRNWTEILSNLSKC